VKGEVSLSDLEELEFVYRDKIKLKPKEQWICDDCSELIEDVKDGWFEWYHHHDSGIEEGFRIVHHNKKCMYNDRALFREGKSNSDMHLDDFVGETGLLSLMTILERNTLKDREELFEMIRRLHVSYYEEARQYWHLADEDYFFEGANEVFPYLPRTSLTIIGKYGNR
jgi:hypothetical protein